MRETELIRSLRAVRQFSDRQIPDDILLDILDTGRWTGSSKNTQPWNLIVVRNRETLVALSKCGQFAGHLAGATLAIVLVMDGDDPWTCMDEGRLMQNLMLAAWAHGVNLFVRTALSVGYPAGPQALRLPANSPVPKGRRPLDEVVGWERFRNRRPPPRPSPQGGGSSTLV